MKRKGGSVVWMTFMGQTFYENVNPYWSFCERTGGVPDRVEIFHSSGNEKELARIVRAFTAISERFDLNRQVAVSGIAFSHREASDFHSRAESSFDRISNSKERLFIDISPTSWSFIPVSLARLAETYGDIVESIGYMHYSDPSYRDSPWPVIPHKGVTRHDFTLTGKSGSSMLPSR